MFVNTAKWAELPPAYQSLLMTAGKAATTEMMAEYDFKNPTAIRQLVDNGTLLRPYPPDVMEACFTACAGPVRRDQRSAIRRSRRSTNSMMAFRAESYLWQQVAEYSFDTFMMVKQREGALDMSG